MTTDEKTDSKSSKGQTSETAINGRTEDSNDANDSKQCIDSKVTAIESKGIQSNNECLEDSNDVNDSKISDKTQSHPLTEVKNDLNDTEMKNAESVENLSTASTSKSRNETNPDERAKFKLKYSKTDYDIEFGLNKNVLQLKEHIQSLTSVPPSMQKLCFRGPLADNKTLREVGIKDNVKVMLIGSTITDVIAVNSTTKEDTKEEKAQISGKEPLCKQKLHKKILDKGMPTDVMPAWMNGTAPLPVEPLYGMINKYGNKVRLTFKLEQDQLWIGTRERTEKLSMMSVRNIISEPIEEHPEYHLMAIQTGPTEASRIWIYWVPAQFVSAIKDTILK